MASILLKQISCTLVFVSAGFFHFSSSAFAQSDGVRIKDLANIRGARSNQLIGFGLVVGLRGTGDSKKSLTTNKAIANMLTRLGMKTDTNDAVSASIAAVVVTGEMLAFARNGDRLDLRVSTIGDAISLAGGTLVLTPLKAGDSQVYGVGQGAVVVGQASGAGVQVQTVANVPSGGVIEREYVSDIGSNGHLLLTLKHPDFTTSARVADRINGFLRGFHAKAMDAASIDVRIPAMNRKEGRLVEFISSIEGLRITTDQKALVVVNERTGTVVMGASIAIEDVSVSHGDLSIQVNSKSKESGKRVVQLETTTVGKLIDSLNAMGAKPADLVGILQAIHAAGALRADLKFM